MLEDHLNDMHFKVCSIEKRGVTAGDAGMFLDKSGAFTKTGDPRPTTAKPIGGDEIDKDENNWWERAERRERRGERGRKSRRERRSVGTNTTDGDGEQRGVTILAPSRSDQRRGKHAEEPPNPTPTPNLEARVEAARSSAVVSEELCKELSSDLARLVKDLADATGSIPSYDQRQNEEQLKALELSVSDLLRSSRPKSKFAFKRKAATPVSINSSRPTDTVGPRNTIPQLVPTTNLSISGHTSQLLTPDSLPSSSSSGRDLAIHDLSGCIVNLLPSDGRTSLDLSAVHIQDLTDTVLLLPAINGSVLIHNLRKCTIVVGCHQFRMHSSQNVDIYLDITSNPIIEHCSTIRFGGYPDSLGLAQKV
ncbi:hypothetical protein H0H87_006307 [Tephrocybe sp. NHM501043]|nr:hypothetical protein H0H87_006307 [Tephrocybe sp. NHM501043]